MPTPPRVIIVGGGFAGLQAAKALSRIPVDITLLDQQNHHCFQPLLYQVATAALSPADVAWPIRSILSAQRNVRVVMAEVVGIDRARRVVESSIGQSYSFDYLVLPLARPTRISGTMTGPFSHRGSSGSKTQLKFVAASCLRTRG